MMLDRMADRLEEKTPNEYPEVEDAFARLEEVARTSNSEGPHQSSAIELATFLSRSRRTEGLVISLTNEI
jgi:hypothetical protein